MLMFVFLTPSSFLWCSLAHACHETCDKNTFIYKYKLGEIVFQKPGMMLIVKQVRSILLQAHRLYVNCSLHIRFSHNSRLLHFNQTHIVMAEMLLQRHNIKAYGSVWKWLLMGITTCWAFQDTFYKVLLRLSFELCTNQNNGKKRLRKKGW